MQRGLGAFDLGGDDRFFADEAVQEPFSAGTIAPATAKRPSAALPSANAAASGPSTMSGGSRGGRGCGTKARTSSPPDFEI